MFLRRAVTTFRPLARARLYSSGYDVNQSIADYHKELEDLFGKHTPSRFAGSVENQTIFQDSPTIHADTPPHDQTTVQQSLVSHRDTTQNEPSFSSGLTHIGTKGEAQMVDISSKDMTKRVAVATCKVILSRTAFDLVSANQVEKGDVLAVAKVAGISGAKQTSNLIPLCHNINLTNVRLDLKLNPSDLSVEIEGEAASTGKTGVEMEALTAVTVAGLTVYDMCKAASKEIVITDVRLERKSGGKTGDWARKK